MKLRYLMLITSLITVMGCATDPEELLPTGNQTMKQIWAGGGDDGSDNGTSVGSLHEARNALQFTRPIDSAESYAGENKSYTRTSANETTNLFPRLPNPDLVMFVFPHLTSDIEPVPVPGYTTVFPFYGRIQYAQPGERTRAY